jgi:hypothetical protein
MGSNGHWIVVFLLLCKLLLRVFSSMLFLLSFYVRIPKRFYPSYPAISAVAINDNNHQHAFVACSIFSNTLGYGSTTTEAKHEESLQDGPDFERFERK